MYMVVVSTEIPALLFLTRHIYIFLLISLQFYRTFSDICRHPCILTLMIPSSPIFLPSPCHVYWHCLVTNYIHIYVDPRNYFPWCRDSLLSLYSQPLSILLGDYKELKNVCWMSDELLNILPQNCFHGQKDW